MEERRRRLQKAAEQTEETASDAPLTTDERHTLLFAYEMLVLRGQTQANLVWQTPSLGLTAQAFLLAIALAADVPNVPRVLAALLGLVVALISMQTMAKHRYFENLDNFKMQQLELQLGLPPMARRGWQNDTTSPGLPQKKLPILPSSYRVWQYGLAVFAIVDVLLVIGYMSGWHILESKH